MKEKGDEDKLARDEEEYKRVCAELEVQVEKGEMNKNHAFDIIAQDLTDQIENLAEA